MEIPNFHTFIPQRCEKAHFEKLLDVMHYILLKIYTVNKNNNENNNKNHRPE